MARYTEPVYPVKKLVPLTAELAERIREFRFNQRIESENEAVRQLIEAGLNATAPNSTRNPKPGGGGGAEKPSGQIVHSVKPARSSTRRTPKAAPVSKEAQLRALREQAAR